MTDQRLKKTNLEELMSLMGTPARRTEGNGGVLW